MAVIINKIIVTMKLIFAHFKACASLSVICEDVSSWSSCIKLSSYFPNLGIMSLVVTSNIVGSNTTTLAAIKYQFIATFVLIESETIRVAGSVNE